MDVTVNVTVSVRGEDEGGLRKVRISKGEWSHVGVTIEVKEGMTPIAKEGVVVHVTVEVKVCVKECVKACKGECKVNERNSERNRR